MFIHVVINPTAPHLATSPDRRTYDPTAMSPWGLLEIKCPISDSITALEYLKCRNGTYKLRKTHNLYHQVMGQMLLSDAEWVDFFVWCKTDYRLESIDFDPNFCMQLKEKLD